MKLSKITIRNFKAFESVDVHLNPDVNIFTGVNNSGKTTILEAIALWAECFQLLLRSAGREVRKKQLARGDYLLERHLYVLPEQIRSVRSPTYADLFHLGETDRSIDLEAELGALKIGFRIRAARGAFYEIIFSSYESFDYSQFNAAFQSFPEPIQVIHASPVAVLPPREEFDTLPKIRGRVRERESGRVFRNRLYQLKKNRVQFTEFLKQVSYVLNAGNDPVDFSFTSDETRHQLVKVLVQIGSRDNSRDLSLLGSGTLQIMEVLLSVHEALIGDVGRPRDLNLILLDEPDSHIHRDIQRRLIRTLSEQSTICQIFGTTHNESLIRSLPATQLFHLEPASTRVYRPIAHGVPKGMKEGLPPSRHIKVLTSLGSESALDLLNALEAQWLVLVEGEDDARRIQAIEEKQWLPSRPFSAMYWSFRGVSNLLGHITTYRKLFELIRNDKSLWDKAALVFDADDFTPDQRVKIQDALRQALKIPVYIWPAYTMEATILAEPDKLIALLSALAQEKRKPTGTNAQITEPVTRGIEALEKKFRARLDDKTHMNGVFERLKAKREQLAEILGKGGNSLIGQDGMIQTTYRSECLKLLDKHQVHHMANKGDVIEVVRPVYEALSIPFDEHRYFLELIETSNLSTRFDSWSEMAKIFT